MPVLEDLRELFLKYDLIHHVDTLASLIDQAQLESPEFVRRLQSGLIWGSAGSIMDTVLQYDAKGPREQLRNDDLRLLRLLVTLAEEMRAQGIVDERIQRMTEGVSRALDERRDNPEDPR